MRGTIDERNPIEATATPEILTPVATSDTRKSSTVDHLKVDNANFGEIGDDNTMVVGKPAILA